MELDKQQAEHALYLMACSRFFEQRIDTYFKAKQMRGTTHLSIGQEAAQAGLVMALRDGDWIVPTHRNHGVTLCRGTDMSRMFSEMFGSREGICAGLGGSMHMTDVSHWNAGSSAVVGSGVPIALGLAFALRQEGNGNLAVAIFGDGATSRGTVHECMNLASVWHLPLLFYLENNGYGMSASVKNVVATDVIARRAEGYRMPWARCDGNDFDAVLNAADTACQTIRESGGPYFLEVMTYRENGHSKSDTCAYRSRSEEEAWRKKDPINLYAARLVKDGICSSEETDRIQAQAKTAVDEADRKAASTKDDRLSLQEALSMVYAPECTSPSTAEAFHNGSFREAIREALDEEMSRDSHVQLWGEDIGLYGGCFGVTGDLVKRHPAQVRETPVCEESFTGMAVGASLLGVRPVVEIMYGDFCTLASDPLVNHAAKIRFMSAGQLSCPMVLRTPMGSGTGHGSQHTQSLEGMFATIPGLVVVAPSTPKDAKALLKSAIRSNNPVLFFEHKLLYGEEGQIADGGYVMPLGKADIKRQGTDVTLVCYSRAVQTCLEAAKQLETEGISAEVLDLCTLRPMDITAILASVGKTGRLVMVQESADFGGFGAAVVAAVTQDPKTFSRLKAHPVLLCGKDCPIPFRKELEEAMVPSSEDVISGVKRLM